MTTRRGFLAGFVAAASGLLVPEPVRAYSFAGGWNPLVAWITVNGKRMFEITERQCGGSVDLGLTSSGLGIGVEVVDYDFFRAFPIDVHHVPHAMPGMVFATMYGPSKAPAGGAKVRPNMLAVYPAGVITERQADAMLGGAPW